jgi:hypothetical protein
MQAESKAMSAQRLAFLDPTRAAGTEDEILEEFRAVRDEIARQVPELLRRRFINNT